ncbi:MAG: rRNA pseudouridine synthase [Clostridiales bacterium]|nr:rRNA pseudouridine synthase [Clostridiales bacterium]
MEERLQKYLASCGVGSRRTSEEYIKEGKVKVNDKVITELGYKVNDKDIVKYNNKVVSKEEKKVYILLNKPLGYVTTLSDEQKRKTIKHLVKTKERVVPVGRLDMYTSGMLLLTNDGDFVYELTHPKHDITKTYEVCIDTEITDEEIEILKNPIDIDGYITKGAEVKVIDILPKKTKLHITISEGRNRQVRKMIEHIGHKIMYLKRIAIGNLKMENIPLGKWKYLTENDLKKIYQK